VSDGAGKVSAHMICAFPYHDPDGIYNQVFERQLDHLKTAFDSICISASPPTLASNTAFVDYLGQQGCHLFANQPGSMLGDHFRQALRLAVSHTGDRQPVFFGFIDRILFVLETHWKEHFLQDLKECATRECVLFERSAFAWDTHPANYREMEQMVSRAGEWLYGESIELGLCGLILSATAARVIVDQSISPSVEVLAEWVLLAMKNNIPITAKKVDWVLWEDPYWEGIAPEILKQQREQSREETTKRITMNAPFLLVMAEERFRNLNARVERI
jgi:hypothetical protein